MCCVDIKSNETALTIEMIHAGDLALSVAMTSASSILAALFLPLNVFLYVSFGYAGINESSPSDIRRLVPFKILARTLGIVILAVLMGLYVGHKFPNRKRESSMIGNIAGALLGATGFFASSTSCSPAWEQDPQGSFPLSQD